MVLSFIMIYELISWKVYILNYSLLIVFYVELSPLFSEYMMNNVAGIIIAVPYSIF
jgi:hypothetical protein